MSPPAMASSKVSGGRLAGVWRVSEGARSPVPAETEVDSSHTHQVVNSQLLPIPSHSSPCCSRMQPQPGRDPGPAPTFQLRQHFEFGRELVLEVILHTIQIFLVVFHGPRCRQTTASTAKLPSELPAPLPSRATPPREPPVPPINSRRSQRLLSLASGEGRVFTLRGREERNNGSVVEVEDQVRFLLVCTVICPCGRRGNRWD